MAALKSLDIPYTFYDEKHTNFFGSKAALSLYLKACEPKRNDLREMLRKVTAWKLRQWILSGLLVLPAGMTIADVRFEWIHDGLPWWDMSKEVKGDVEAINATLTTRTDVCKQRGLGSWKKIIDRLSEEQEYMESKGVTPAAVDAAIAEAGDNNDDEEIDDESDSEDE